MICPQVLRHKHTFTSYYENPTGRGYFYQMSNMYTCIAYLIEILTFCSKTWFIKVLILTPKML